MISEMDLVDPPKGDSYRLQAEILKSIIQNEYIHTEFSIAKCPARTRLYLLKPPHRVDYVPTSGSSPASSESRSDTISITYHLGYLIFLSNILLAFVSPTEHGDFFSPPEVRARRSTTGVLPVPPMVRLPTTMTSPSRRVERKKSF